MEKALRELPFPDVEVIEIFSFHMQGVNFVQYAVAQANLPQETCERTFQPCDTITPTLQKALIDVKNSMEPLQSVL